LIEEDSSVPPVARNFDVPVFLDTENLTDLAQVQATINKSHNVVIMLTSQVLLRPWVLVEIVTAIRSGIRVVPVQVTKPGADFVFPGEKFYTRLAEGKVLTSDGSQILSDSGVSLLEVESALREVFRHIAIPYSPQRPNEIRQAELKALLKRCHLRKQDGGISFPADLKRLATTESMDAPQQL